MTSRKETMTLDDILNKIVAECERPTREALVACIRRYPQQERELVDFFAAWAEQEVLPVAPAPAPDREKSLVDRAMSHVQNLLYDLDKSAAAVGVNRVADGGIGVVSAAAGIASADPIRSLTGAAKRLGFSPSELGQSWGLDLLLVAKLEARQIRFQSIPPRLIEGIARLLRCPLEAVAAFLSAPPQTAAGRAYLSRRKPEAPQQQTFAEAVQGSGLSAEEKKRWLDEAAGLDPGG